MSNDVGPGRFSKDAARALLARLYLNAAVYRDPYGTPAFTKEDMDKVIQYTSDVIAGPHSLSSEYFDVFNDDNHTNPVLDTEHSRWAYWSISGDQVPEVTTLY